MDDDFQIFTSLRYDPILLQVPAKNLSNSGWNWTNTSPLYMFDYHRDRMLRAATHWGWSAAVEVLQGDSGLQRLAEFVRSNIGENQQSPLRVKICISKAGELSLSSGPVPEVTLGNLFPERFPSPGSSGSDGASASLPSKATAYEVLVDSPKSARSEYTHFKTTKRAVYDEAKKRARIGLTDKKEVLIVHEADGTVMEGAITTPYFWRGGKWVTPAVSRVYNPKEGSGGQDGTSRRWALERGIAVEGTIAANSLVDGEECWLSNGVRGFFFGRVRLA
ncbi:aminotransferase [Corynascus novoguineensis]|uniref:Aminotransferase n=1 Tax=Corynascus novoguineensis TaxID=1126955 RepID=A0AAN7D0D9_9PEZI|nr:aminotransferase [Corynascus novoguineensis]